MASPAEEFALGVRNLFRPLKRNKFRTPNSLPPADQYCVGCVPRTNSELETRNFCTMKGRRVVILHSFIKKSQQTPKKELAIARKRLKEVQNV